MEEFERSYFGRLYDRYAAMLYRVAYCYMGKRQDAEDAVMDTFVKLFRQKTPFASAEHEKAWLIRVCVNECKNKRGEYWRRKVCSLPECLPAPEQETVGVREELEKLSRRQAIAVYLYYYEGYATAEIAHFFGMSESGVRTLLARARRTLRGLLEEDYDEKK